MKSEITLNYAEKGTKQWIPKKRHLEKLISLVVKKGQYSNNETLNTDINNYIINKRINFAENQMPGSNL